MQRLVNYFKGQSEVTKSFYPTTPDPEAVKRLKVLEEIVVGDTKQPDDIATFFNDVKNDPERPKEVFKPAKKTAHATYFYTRKLLPDFDSLALTPWKIVLPMKRNKSCTHYLEEQPKNYFENDMFELFQKLVQC